MIVLPEIINYVIIRMEIKDRLISDSPKKPAVIIIGAGVAGLAAANRLHSVGVPFVILEGSNRVGGRLCSMSW